MPLRLALFGACLLAGAAVAGEPVGRSASPDVLVRRLGDPSFAERERAADELLLLGRAAVPALRRGLDDDDPEVRRRCELLLPVAARTDLDIELDAFIEGSDPKTPLVGWERFRKLAGDDRLTRIVFADLYRHDRDLLAAVEKNDKQVADLLGRRCQRWQRDLNLPPERQQGMAPAEVAALLYLAAVAPPAPNSQPYYVFSSCLYLPAVALQVRECRVCRRLLVGVLNQKTEDANLLQQTVYLTRQLALTELDDAVLKPAVTRLAEKVAQKPDDLNQLFQAVNVAQQLGMTDLLDKRLKPAVRKSAAEAVRKPDQYRLSQTYLMAQNLGMHDLIDATLKPAVRKYIEDRLRQAKGPPPAYDGPPGRRGRRGDDSAFNHIQEVCQLAQMLQLTDVLEATVKPAAYTLIETMVDKAEDANGLQQAIQLVQWFNLQEPLDDLVRPAAARYIAAACDKPGSPNFRQAISFAAQLGLKEVVEDTLRPALVKMAREAAAKPDDVNRLYQVFQDVRSLQLGDVLNDVLKPAVREAVKKIERGPVKVPAVQPLLDMARTMGLEEAADFAVRAALAKDVDAHTRGSAVAFVAEFGGRERALRLEPLLTDKGQLGQVGINYATLSTEVRDVVLAALITAHGERPADYGYLYPALTGEPLNGNSYSCFGFADEQERKAARDKWEKWLAARRK